MTTTEIFIPDCLYEQKSYDVFATMEKNPQHILASDIQTPLRVKIIGIDGWVKSPYDCYCTISLHAFGQPICQAHTTLHSNDGEKLSWDEWVTFPVTYAELPLDTILCLDLYDPDQGHVGGTSAYMYTSRGKLKRGFRRYRIHRGTAADGSEDSQTLGRFPTQPWEDIAQEFQMKRIPQVPWMDKLTTVKLNELAAQRPLETHEIYLLMEFPTFTQPVFYSSELMDGPPPVPLRNAMDTAKTMFDRHMPYYDPDFKTDNPCEHMNTILSKSTHRLLDADVKPNASQLRRIQEIMQSPPIHTPFTSDQITLLWQFGNFLARDASAFVRFMEVVDWQDERESHDAWELAQKWVPISRGDTLSLLSCTFKGVSAMRRHAIGLLRKQSDEELSLVLLQLVQGIRYEAGSDDERANGELSEFLIERCCKSFDLSTKMYWYVTVEMSSEVAPAKCFKEVHRKLCETLNNHETAKIFYAQLKRQEELRKVLQTINKAIRASSDRAQQTQLLKTYLTNRSCGIAELFDNAPVGTDAKDPQHHQRFNVDTFLQSMQDAAKDIKEAAKRGGGAEPTGGPPATTIRANIYNFLEPEIQFVGIDPTKQLIFNSAKRPVALWFKTAAETPEKPLGTYQAIYKNGDDIRQDQLVMQMVQVVDRLLKDDGLDLKLTPYKVLSFSADDGIMEMVPDATTLQDVGAKLGGVQAYLRSVKANVLPSGELDPQVMENFINSCAGYCVITFILGIGDRHLENLLVLRDGRLLHIDFGFILGKDPKPFPKVMKLSKEMIQGMGGLNTKHYEQFKIHCCSAYNTVRKHASLLMNLLVLMLDANIPQLCGEYKNTDPKLNLLKVQDKLRLDLNNVDATQYIQEVINECAASYWGGAVDLAHEFVVKLRS
jgi:phosphatidylinositol 3-kinase